MKNPKLIDEAWIDECLLEQYRHFTVTNLVSYKDKIELLDEIKSKLQPLPTPTKTNVEKIRTGEMAIENDVDNPEKLKALLRYLWPKDKCDNVDAFINDFYIQDNGIESRWWCPTQVVIPTIKASELIKEIQGVSEPTPEWQPKFGDKITVNDCGIIKDGVCVVTIDGIVHWL